MGDKNVGYRHGDYPIGVNGTFVKRVQSFDVRTTIPTDNVDELGNVIPAGVFQDTKQYTGRIVWFPIGNEVELAMTGGSAPPVNLSAFPTATGVKVEGPKQGISGAKVTRLEYDCRVGDFFRGTIALEGTGATSGSAIAPVTPPTGDAGQRAKDVKVEVDSATAVRAQGFRITGDLRPTRLFELNNEDQVGTGYDTPQVTCDIDFVESDLIAGNVEATLAVPKDIVITVSGAGGVIKVITLKDIVTSDKGYGGNVRGWATQRWSYRAKGTHTSGGMIISA